MNKWIAEAIFPLSIERVHVLVTEQETDGDESGHAMVLFLLPSGPSNLSTHLDAQRDSADWAGDSNRGRHVGSGFS